MRPSVKILLAAATIASVSSASAATLLTNTFDTTTESWVSYVGGGSTLPTVSQTGTDPLFTNALSVAYVTNGAASGATRTLSQGQLLGVGDSLSFTFDFHFVNAPTAATGLRFGLVATGTPNNVLRTNFSTGTAGVPALAYDGSGDYLTGTATAITATGGTSLSITDTSAYTLGLNITRTATGYDVYSTRNGVNVSGTGSYATGSDFNFNQLVIGVPSSGTDKTNFAVDNVLLTYTAVPEPGALSALLGGTGMLLGLRRRRA